MPNGPLHVPQRVWNKKVKTGPEMGLIDVHASSWQDFPLIFYPD